MALPEPALQKAINDEVTGDGSEAAFARRLESNFESLESRISALEERQRDWVAWTPTWTNLTVGNGTVRAQYAILGNTALFSLKLLFGSTTSITGTPKFTLPPNTATISQGDTGGLVRSFDASANLHVTGSWLATSTDQITPCVQGDGAVSGGAYDELVVLSSTIPFTWATDDVLTVIGFYETIATAGGRQLWRYPA